MLAAWGRQQDNVIGSNRPPTHFPCFVVFGVDAGYVNAAQPEIESRRAYKSIS